MSIFTDCQSIKMVRQKTTFAVEKLWNKASHQLHYDKLKR
ncbi:hypothetical protein BAGQ_0592 [Bacillus velezensis]|nr:hypothetical protein BCBMB205_05290 [Bacillus velezensis]ARZ56854.1 hypothetical protein BAGQ_0592 [Bacillus velezensis]